MQKWPPNWRSLNRPCAGHSASSPSAIVRRLEITTFAATFPGFIAIWIGALKPYAPFALAVWWGMLRKRPPHHAEPLSPLRWLNE